MGRRQKQTADYFPHSVTNDPTKFILEDSWGNDGYAFWYKLQEVLGESEGHWFDCSIAAKERYLVAKVKLSKETIYEILAALVDLEEIDKELWEERKVIWSQRFVDNLKELYAKRTTPLPTRPFTKTEKAEIAPPPTTGEQVKDEAKKRDKPSRVEAEEKPKSKKAGFLTATQQNFFDKFYACYPKKVDRATAERAWAKIEPQPDEAMTDKIIQAVEASKKYDSRFRERQFTPNPASWLNAKGYLNEYTQEGGDNYGGFNQNRGNDKQQSAGSPGDFKPSGGFKR